MLRMIRDALRELAENQKAEENVGTNVVINVETTVGTNEEKLLELLRQDGKLTAKVLARATEISYSVETLDYCGN